MYVPLSDSVCVLSSIDLSFSLNYLAIDVLQRDVEQAEYYDCVLLPSATTLTRLTSMLYTYGQDDGVYP